MKYLKLFEDTIKHSDPITIKHSILDFSKRLENIVIELQKLDFNQRTKTKRFSKEDGLISITYSSVK